ncbi:PACE efflux transporter [Parendozoicomonas sp. Alg238-R29]|uniref:PACE efflux transporter n=1 Tax=Parendozoicomonas sp. Alg238-R29 TaxID=2993446 RepID=UPI00248D6E2C|nr:PACE efflux transporter [Parendozoicomonas sp. Alg238-R29]
MQTTKERIFHMVLFEAVALILLAVLAMIFTGGDALSMTGLALTLSLIAMVWNYIYNIVFDRIFGTNRIERTLALRIGHGVVFEIGMIVFSFPVIMWALQLDFWTVLIMDLGVVLFFLVYAVVFNWIYDIVRHKRRSSPPAS